MVHAKSQLQHLASKSSLNLAPSTTLPANKAKLHRGDSNLENRPSGLSSSNRKISKSGASLGLISQEEEKVALNVSQSGNLSQILDEEAYW